MPLLNVTYSPGNKYIVTVTVTVPSQESCFGIVIWAIPGIVAALVTDNVGSKKTARVLSMIFFFFSFGQISGPAVAGYLAELTQSFSPSFYLITDLTILAVILSALLERPSKSL